MTELTPDTLLQRNPDLVCGEIDGELIALRLDNGTYLHMNRTASRLLALLDGVEASSPAALVAQLVREFRIDEQACLRDVMIAARRCLELDVLRVVTPG